MEKRTRVRARMISQALQELMAQSDQLFVMGHTNPDMDSIGACLGIRRIAEMNGKECWIVIDDEHPHSDIQRLMHEIDNYQTIKDHIISPVEALEKATNNSLLVMVDHAKRELPLLLNYMIKCKTDLLSLTTTVAARTFLKIHCLFISNHMLHQLVS